jgi:hypothetical protein
MQEFGSGSVPGVASVSNDMAMTFDKVPVQPGVPENSVGPAKPEDPQQLSGDVDALWEAVKALQQQVQSLLQTLSQTQQQLNQVQQQVGPLNTHEHKYGGGAVGMPRAIINWATVKNAPSSEDWSFWVLPQGSSGEPIDEPPGTTGPPQQPAAQ